MIMWSMVLIYKGMYSNVRFQISRFDGSACKSYVFARMINADTHNYMYNHMKIIQIPSDDTFLSWQRAW